MWIKTKQLRTVNLARMVHLAQMVHLARMVHLPQMVHLARGQFEHIINIDILA